MLSLGKGWRKLSAHGVQRLSNRRRVSLVLRRYLTTLFYTIGVSQWRGQEQRPEVPARFLNIRMAAVPQHTQLMDELAAFQNPSMHVVLFRKENEKNEHSTTKGFQQTQASEPVPTLVSFMVFGRIGLHYHLKLLGQLTLWDQSAQRGGFEMSYCQRQRCEPRCTKWLQTCFQHLTCQLGLSVFLQLHLWM